MVSTEVRTIVMCKVWVMVRMEVSVCCEIRFRVGVKRISK